MELKSISKEVIDEYKEFILERLTIRPTDTPTAIASRAWYRGFKDFRFDDARALAEKVKQIYLTHINKKTISEVRDMIF
jgi:hypothetical protein